jgi:hypothetical protein
MARAPSKPEDIFTEFTGDLQRIFGEDLVSIILYGSGATGEYRPGKSDLNFLVVLQDDSVDSLRRGMAAVARWRKRMVNTPLFMTKVYIQSSLDSYPIEFLDMQANYRLVHGEDVLKDLQFRPADLRVQCERELKGKALRLRQVYLEAREKPRAMREIIAGSITAFTSIFQGLLFLVGKDIPKTKGEIINRVAQEFQLDADTFLKLLAIKTGERKASPTEIRELFKKYVSEIDALSGAVDKLTLKKEESEA